MEKKDDIGEEVDAEDLAIINKVLSKPQIIYVVVMIALVIMFLFVGKQVGYIQGYTYVNDWYENYIEKQCTCTEVVNNKLAYSNSSNFWKLNVEQDTNSS